MRRGDQLRRYVVDFLKSPRAAEATRLGWTELDRRLSPPRPPTVPSRRRCGPLIGEQRRQASGRRLAQKKLTITVMPVTLWCAGKV